MEWFGRLHGLLGRKGSRDRQRSRIWGLRLPVDRTVDAERQAPDEVVIEQNDGDEVALSILPQQIGALVLSQRPARLSFWRKSVN